MKNIAILLILLIISLMEKPQRLETVTYVDIEKYSGKWYEIASYPQRFQKGCHCTTAEYSLSKNGHVIVENQCNKYSVSGEVAYIKGKAFIVKNSGNAKLKVQFFWPFKGKYWIIDLANDYSYAVVSHPNRKYLWVLSRTPQIEDSVYQAILNRLEAKGFELSKLKTTIQVSK